MWADIQLQPMAEPEITQMKLICQHFSTAASGQHEGTHRNHRKRKMNRQGKLNTFDTLVVWDSFCEAIPGLAWPAFLFRSKPGLSIYRHFFKVEEKRGYRRQHSGLLHGSQWERSQTKGYWNLWKKTPHNFNALGDQNQNINGVFKSDRGLYKNIKTQPHIKIM